MRKTKSKEEIYHQLRVYLTLTKPVTKCNKFRNEQLKEKLIRTLENINNATTSDEIQKAVKYLKNKKASELDVIRNEMSKCFNVILLVKVEELLNNFFNSSYYPDA